MVKQDECFSLSILTDFTEYGNNTVVWILISKYYTTNLTRVIVFALFLLETFTSTI